MNPPQHNTLLKKSKLRDIVTFKQVKKKLKTKIDPKKKTQNKSLSGSRCLFASTL